VGELLYGSPAHRPISSVELTEWALVWQIRADEQEKAAKASRRR
jgi:hypothetical protein